MVSRFGGSSLGLAYSIVLTDAAIAPAFPSNTARGGVLFPIVLSVVTGAGSKPEEPEGRRLGGYLMFCGMASLALSSALWMTATSCNPIAVQIVQKPTKGKGGKRMKTSWMRVLAVAFGVAVFAISGFAPSVEAQEKPDAPAPKVGASLYPAARVYDARAYHPRLKRRSYFACSAW